MKKVTFQRCDLSLGNKPLGEVVCFEVVSPSGEKIMSGQRRAISITAWQRVKRTTTRRWCMPRCSLPMAMFGQLWP